MKFFSFPRLAPMGTALLLMLISAKGNAESPRYAGGDISLLPEYEEAGAVYKTHDGKPIAELLPWLAEQGMNAMRVRLFVDPEAYDEADADPNACQTLDYILPLCRRIKEQGMALMLDFHYSDTWADPAKQWTPAAWQGLDDEALGVRIYEYTRDVLRTLNEAEATPDFIQTGNEISFGMLWGSPSDKESDLKKTYMGRNANWERLGMLLKEAIRACREECPQAGIVLHTERVADTPVLKNFYRRMEELGVSYEVIGLSYYPYFHGPMSKLEAALEMLEKEFPSKAIMIVETGYPYKWEIPGTTEKVDYPYSDTGQNAFAKALVDMLEQHPAVDGLFWWWLEYNAYGTSLANWYNAPLFDSLTGRATSALTTICSFARGGTGISGMDSEVTPCPTLYDMQGHPLTTPRRGQPYVEAGKGIRIKE